MSGLLASIFSAGDRLKRKVNGLLDDPAGTIVQQVGLLNDNARSFNQLHSKATQESVNSIKGGGSGFGLASQQLAGKLADAYNPMGMLLYHGSNTVTPISKIDDGHVFGGLFASGDKGAALSHGNKLYRMTVPDEKIMPTNPDIPWGEALDFVRSRLHTDDVSEDIADVVISGKKSAWNAGIDEQSLLDALKAEDMGWADWELQNLRGQLARKFGYKAAEMPDEHGISYLVLPGIKPRPYNQEAKDLARKAKNK